jgi:peptidoglycan hydrolase-like protein with peptidoglycan-binding domain
MTRTIFVLMACVALAFTAMVGLVGRAQTTQQKPELQSRRNLVEDAQQALKDRGYYDGPADGIMGLQTRQAVRKFQNDRHLPVTGQLDEETVRQLGISLEEESPAKEEPGAFGKMGSGIKKGTVTGAKATAKGATVAAKETAESPAGKATAKGATTTAKATAKGTKKAASAVKGVFTGKKP